MSWGVTQLSGISEDYQIGKRILGRFKWEEAGIRASLQGLLEWLRRSVWTGPDKLLWVQRFH